MCNKITYYYILAFIFVMASIELVGQSRDINLAIPEIALVDIEPNTNAIEFNIQPPTEAGNNIVVSPNTSKWINYTSTIQTGGPSRFITASLSNTLDGININLQAGNASGGFGNLGTPTGQITLTTIDTMIIQGIGGASSGNGGGNGHQLTFTIVLSNFENLTATGLGVENITVTYTISN